LGSSINLVSNRRKKEFAMNRTLSLVFVLIAVLASMAGCGQTARDGSEPSGNGTTSAKNSSIERRAELVGIWLGTARWDRDGFQRHLEGVTDANDRLRLSQMAQTFESISIGMEFRSNGEMEIEMEIIPPNSTPIRESTVGNWRVKSINGNSFILECSEQTDSGQMQTQTLQYELSGDRNQLVTAAPVGEDLRAFQPQFVFERRVAASVAESPETHEPVIR
jgi:hypothetical protein